jgi:hypothetical protein
MSSITPSTSAAPRVATQPTSWPLERVLFALAGSMTLLSVLLAGFITPWFLLLTVFVGVNQWLFVLFGACPASLILGHLGVARACRR